MDPKATSVARICCCANFGPNPISLRANPCCNGGVAAIVGTVPKRGAAVRRRDLIKGIAGAAITRPLAARAQQPAAKVPIITFINARRASVSAAVAAEFRKGLSQTGLTDGKDFVVEYHWLDGHYEDIPAILADAIARGVAVVATPGNTPGTLAAKAATSTIPIVFGVSEDPVALGLVGSLAQPGGNVTGINFFASEIDAKRLGLMHELLPKAKRFAVLVNPANAATAAATTTAVKETAPGLGLDLQFSERARPPKSMLRSPASPMHGQMSCSWRRTLFSPADASKWPRSQHAPEYRPALSPASWRQPAFS